MKNYNVLIDRRNFYDQPINDVIKQYDEVRKGSTGYGDDYTTELCIFQRSLQTIVADLSK